MRILLLTDMYPPYPGGVEQHVRSLSAELAQRGHTVAIVTLEHPRAPHIEQEEAVRIYRIGGFTQKAPGIYVDPNRRFAPPFPDPLLTAKIRRILRRERPDIVHAHSGMLHSVLPLKAGRRLPVIVTLHSYRLACIRSDLMRGGIHPCEGPGPLKCLSCSIRSYGPVKGSAMFGTATFANQIERLAVDMFLPVSRAVARGAGLAESRQSYRVIPPFIRDDAEVIGKTVEPYLARLPEEFILFAGALIKNKGVDVLLDAYDRLPDAPPLVLIGGSANDAEIDRALVAAGSKVTVYRDWPHEAVMGAWGRSLFAVVPSVWADPAPAVAIEAMATGRPVVASRVGGLVELVPDGEAGLLVPPADRDALAQAMARLLTDPTMRARMGLAASKTAELFRARTVVPQIECAYREVIESRAVTTSELISGRAS